LLDPCPQQMFDNCNFGEQSHKRFAEIVHRKSAPVSSANR
jgi:hypothetical protein